MIAYVAITSNTTVSVIREENNYLLSSNIGNISSCQVYDKADMLFYEQNLLLLATGSSVNVDREKQKY